MYICNVFDSNKSPKAKVTVKGSIQQTKKKHYNSVIFFKVNKRLRSQPAS